MLEARTKALKRAERKIVELTEENCAVHEENKDLRSDNEEFRFLLQKIKDTVESNNYNRADIQISKIKELIQSGI